jgi:hypothetical protein
MPSLKPKIGVPGYPVPARPMKWPEPMSRSPIDFGYGKLEPKRPTVIRKGDVVKKCFYFQGMCGQCLGVRCYWPKVGSCEIYKKKFSRTKAGIIAGRKHKGKNGNGTIKKRRIAAMIF